MLRWIFAALVCAGVGCLTAAAAEPAARITDRKVTLKEAVGRALNASPALQSREELIAGAEAQVRQSAVLPNPELGLELENFAGSGQFEGIEQSELTAAVTQRLERGGKRGARVALAQAERDIAAIERDRSRLDVALEARRAFIEVSAATVLVDIAKARLDTATRVEGLAARRVSAARDPATVKLRAEIQTADARSAHGQAMVALQGAKKRLASLWGEPDVRFSVDTTALFSVPNATPDQAAAVVSPDVAAREAAARRATSKVDLETANASADVTVGLGVRRFEAGGDLAAVASLSVPLTIFDDNQGNIDRAAAERRAAELDVLDAKRVSDRERLTLVEEATRTRAEAVTIRQDLLPRAEQALRIARRGYDAGAFSYLELSESQRTLSELRTREVEALRRLHVALAGLDRLSGRLPVATTRQGQRP
jgi:outer membrane protein, heavy metal efflux system